MARDRALHPSPVLFTSPTTHGRNFSTVAFETDLPRIEASDSQANPPFCNRTTGANCVNPPAGAQFYPFYSTTVRYGSCTWQEGGNFIPHTTNNFGGSSTTEYGPLLKTVYPVAGHKTEDSHQQLQQRGHGQSLPGSLGGPAEASPDIRH